MTDTVTDALSSVADVLNQRAEWLDAGTPIWDQLASEMPEVGVALENPWNFECFMLEWNHAYDRTRKASR